MREKLKADEVSIRSILGVREGTANTSLLPTVEAFILRPGTDPLRGEGEGTAFMSLPVYG